MTLNLINNTDNKHTQMKNSINLSDIAKQKSLQLSTANNIYQNQLQPAQHSPSNAKPKLWPNINTKGNVGKEPKIGNGKHWAAGQCSDSQRGRKGDNSIGSVDISKNGQQLSDVFKNVGLQTLMNITLSDIQNGKNDGKIGDIAHNNASKKQQTQQCLKRQVQEMKRKLSKILDNHNNHIAIGNHQPSNPLSIALLSSASPSSSSEDKYLKWLNHQKNKDKANTFQKMVFRIAVKKYFRELSLFVNIRLFVKKRQERIKRKYMKNMNEVVTKQGERKAIMESIRRRIIEKRKTLTRKKEMERALLIGTQQ